MGGKTNVFVSYDHADQAQVNGFRGLVTNENHPLEFHDRSLLEPVVDRRGTPLPYPPSDSRSQPVRDAIIAKFARAAKLVVLIGPQTYDSEWVAWEVETFFRMKQPIAKDNTWKRIRGMRLKGHDDAKMPASLAGRSTQVLSWDPEALDKWIDYKLDE